MDPTIRNTGLIAAVTFFVTRDITQTVVMSGLGYILFKPKETILRGRGGNVVRANVINPSRIPNSIPLSPNEVIDKPSRSYHSSKYMNKDFGGRGHR